MPIEHGVSFRRISQAEFMAMDFAVMQHVFAMQHDLGRFCDERIYQNELAARLIKNGFGDVAREVPIHVSHGTFRKTYFMDMLVNASGLLELKTVESLTGEHTMQALHYLLLSGLSHGKLINLRPPSVQHRFVSTRLTPAKRHVIHVDTGAWDDTDGDGLWFRTTMTDLISDWGLFLDISLFYQAITEFRGGEENVLTRLPICRDGRELGFQRIHLLNQHTAFRLSGVRGDIHQYGDHLRRFLLLTRLDTVQWVNFDHHNVTFVTVRKD